MAAVIDTLKCTKCQACVGACPVECIKGKAETVPVIDAGECIDCGICESECPAEAISLE